jgi:hypothetical protein
MTNVTKMLSATRQMRMTSQGLYVCALPPPLRGRAGEGGVHELFRQCTTPTLTLPRRGGGNEWASPARDPAMRPTRCLSEVR